MQQRPGFFGAGIRLRVVYALVASSLWWALVEFSNMPSSVLTTWSLFHATGAVFGALVLVPYLPDLKGTRKLRALALLLCGALSYWLAIFRFQEGWLLAAQFPFDRSYLARGLGEAGILGALIVGIGARAIIPLSLRWSGWLMLVVAGGVGGLVLSTGFNAGISSALGQYDYQYWLPGHIAWEVLVCVALFYGSRRDVGGHTVAAHQ
jgi:hypothetical protein